MKIDEHAYASEFFNLGCPSTAPCLSSCSALLPGGHICFATMAAKMSAASAAAPAVNFTDKDGSGGNIFGVLSGKNHEESIAKENNAVRMVADSKYQRSFVCHDDSIVREISDLIQDNVDNDRTLSYGLLEKYGVSNVSFTSLSKSMQGDILKVYNWKARQMHMYLEPFTSVLHRGGEKLCTFSHLFVELSTESYPLMKEKVRVSPDNRGRALSGKCNACWCNNPDIWAVILVLLHHVGLTLQQLESLVKETGQVHSLPELLHVSHMYYLVTGFGDRRNELVEHLSHINCEFGKEKALRITAMT